MDNDLVNAKWFDCKRFNWHISAGLPEKWLGNISVVNAMGKVRLYRIKHTSLIDIDILARRKAMIASNVYEIEFVDITLSHNTG